MSKPADLTRLRIDEFLDQLRARTPTPGGGSAVALAGAVAAALGHMVIAYSTKPDSDEATVRVMEETGRRLARAEELLRAMITHDAAAYATLHEVSKRRKESPNEGSYQEAVLAAAAVPFEVAAIASQVLMSLDEQRERINPHLCSDLAVAAILAEAVAAAAAHLLETNARELEDRPRRERMIASMRAIGLRCRSTRDQIESFVSTTLHRGAATAKVEMKPPTLANGH